jgi:serine protease Do
VAAVTSGSSADEAGVQGGDIITSLEGLYVGSDGTMADYCDVLRSHEASDKLAIEVLRFSSGEVMSGQLNGDPLVTSFSFSNEVSNDPGAAPAAGDAYAEYVAVQDDYGAIQMEVPIGWSEVDGRPETWDSGANFASVYAAPNLNDFQNTWVTPGVMFRATADKEKVGGHLQMLDASRSSALVQDCTLDQRYDYNDGVYRGAFDYYNRCGGTATDYMILSAVPIQGNTNVLIFVEIQIVNQADLDAADRILATFDIVGNLP